LLRCFFYNVLPTTHSYTLSLHDALPIYAHGRKNRIFSFHIDAYAENELQIRAVNVRPADEERHVEIIPKQMAESRIVEARLRKRDRKSTRLNSSHLGISYAVFCLKKKKK